MPTLVTPSAKAHERVTGRWLRDVNVQSKGEWLVHYMKLLVGSPVPWLFCAYAILTLVSRAGLEVVAWVSASLTWAYVIVDRFSRSKEFEFFRVGSDVFLLGYFVVGLLGAIGLSPEEGLATISGVRWVILLYATAYCFELFPGVNRIYYLLIGTACVATGFGIWQHFTGVDIIRGENLAVAPAADHVYFIARGFASTPEIFATLLAMLLPFPISAFLLMEEKGSHLERWSYALVAFLLMTGIVWTYRPGLWIAALVGLAVTLLMQGKHVFLFLAATAVFLGGLFYLSYSSPEDLLTRLQDSEISRATLQRTQINTQVEIWQENIWIGAGQKASDVPNYDPGIGNTYFHVLAQFGIFGSAFYLLFILGYLLTTYRIFFEIPRSHFAHRVLASGGLAAQIAFHVSGLYWATLRESMALYLFVIILASLAYVHEHYNRGPVPDDTSL